MSGGSRHLRPQRATARAKLKQPFTVLHKQRVLESGPAPTEVRKRVRAGLKVEQQRPQRDVRALEIHHVVAGGSDKHLNGARKGIEAGMHSHQQHKKGFGAGRNTTVHAR